MVGAEHGTAACPQTFPHRDVLLRIDLIGHFAFTEVVRPDVFVDHVVLSCEQAATLERQHVPRMTDDAVQHVQGDLQSHVSRAMIMIAVPADS
jgi:hypothetical protein